jgi:hypothetical protein
LRLSPGVQTCPVSERTKPHYRVHCRMYSFKLGISLKCLSNPRREETRAKKRAPICRMSPKNCLTKQTENRHKSYPLYYRWITLAANWITPGLAWRHAGWARFRTQAAPFRPRLRGWSQCLLEPPDTAARMATEGAAYGEEYENDESRAKRRRCRQP